MRIVVTGGTGFIGSEAVDDLATRHEVHCITRTGDTPEGAQGHALDLLTEDPAPLLAKLEPEAMLHLAWHVPPGMFWTAPENLDWVAASLRLYRAFAEAGGARAVFAGTCAEYDWSGDTLDEATTPLKPHTLYGEAKASLYRIVMAAAPHLEVSTAWGRIFYAYGPYEKPNRLFSSIVDQVAKGHPVHTSAGTQLRDFMHVSDCSRAFAALLESDVEGAVNIATGTVHTVREFIEHSARHAGDESLVAIGVRPFQKGEPPVMRASADRLLKEVGFVPTYDLEAGIASAVRDRLAA